MRCFFIAVFAAVLLTVLSGAVPAQANPTDAQIAMQIGAVFVIAMENHNFAQPSPTSSPEQLLGNPAAPYFNSLITAGNSNSFYVSYATQYYNAGNGVHPSEPNYVWAEAGTDFGVHTDNDPGSSSGNIFTAPHLTAQMNTAGITWKNYQEDVELSSSPLISASGNSATVINPYYNTGEYGYAVKHNPMAFFSDTPTQNVYPLTNLVSDLANNHVGRYNWITPNLYNDQHSPLSTVFTYHGTNYSGDQSAVAQGDNFLSIVVPQIMASAAYKNNGAIIIRMDETEGGDTTSYTLPEVVISPLAKGNAYASSVVMSHSSDLKMMEEMLGLGFLSNAIPASETAASGSGYNNVATVNDLSDLFRAAPQIGVQQPPGSALTNGVSTVNFGDVFAGSSVTNVFIVTNSGIATLTITNIGFTDANPGDFAVSGLTFPALVATNGTATFQVAFTPPTAGPFAATLQITNNDPSHSLFTITLAGTGISNTAPVLSTTCTFPANGFQLSFTASIGQHYRVLGSEDVATPLTNWTVLAESTVVSNPVIYTDMTVATNPVRFYRIVSP